MTELIEPLETEDEGSTRKLAAIMFTDIKGFSKKMGENEEAAFELLKTHDAIMRVLSAKFGGKVIKSIGDSFMVDFSSAVNAVKCAIEAQKRFWSFNVDKDEFHKIEIRIGIHMGDVIIRGEDIYGDGVNIASRIEAITQPNRICISQDVYNQLKNKIPVRVFGIGGMKLKNIAEPVEVFEILIDSIPELSTPSKSAQEAMSKKKEDAVSKTEAEEATEAKQVEEAKKRVSKGQAHVEEKRRAVEEIYAKAEKLFAEGKFDEAESQLNEIYKIDPAFQSSIQRKKDEEGNEKRAQEHITNAKNHLSRRDLKAAEGEINEIFRFLPLHTGAQQILLQIEEERYRMEEEDRLKRSATEKKEKDKVVTADERKIEELLSRTRQLLEQEQFTEASASLRELFLLDPNHEGAHRLEESIQQAHQAKIELEKVQAEQGVEEQRTKQLAVLQQKLEEQKKKKQYAFEIHRKGKQRRFIMGIAAAVVAIGILALIPSLLRTLFPKSISLAVIQFTTEGQESGDASDVQAMLPVLLAEDFARCSNVSVIAGTSSSLIDPRSVNLKNLSTTLKIQELVTGTVKRDSTQYSIAVRLMDLEGETTVWSAKFDTDLNGLHKVRSLIVHNVLASLEVDSPVEQIPAPGLGAEAYEQFLNARRLLLSPSPSSANQARTILLALLENEPSSGPVSAYLAEASMEFWKSHRSDEQALRDAFDYAQRALRTNTNNACAYEVLGEYFRATQQYQKVTGSLEKSLELQPGNPACYRELASIALVAGEYDLALKHATDAHSLDPKNPDTHFILGLVYHMRKEYGSAVAAYQDATSMGDSDSLITSDYLLSSLVEQGQLDKAIEGGLGLLQMAPDDYRFHYMLARIYQNAVKIAEANEHLNDGLALVQKTLETNPNDATAYSYGALFYSRLGKYPEGEAMMKKAVELNPNSADILYRQAGLYSIQKKFPNSLSSLNSAVNKRYDFSKILDLDLILVSHEPEFPDAIVRSIDSATPSK
ncbi:MAG: adenylate/guanylate cyclase domain-containing protein [Bacteroidota bacterium]